MPKVGKRKISLRKKPGGSKVGNTLRKVASKVRGNKKVTTRGGVKTITKTSKNPLTGRTRKVEKTKIATRVNNKGKTVYSKTRKKVQVTKRKKGTLGERRVVKTKDAHYSPTGEFKRVPTSKTKRAVKYNRKHVEKDKTITKQRGARVKTQKFTGVPRTQRKSVRRIIK
jgi:hypothetical protein